VDLLLEQPEVDDQRVLAMGHSLGGKMAFYSTAFDQRITACIASDFGIAWDFTNWEMPWYFGEQILDDSFKLNGHHALALIAPRSFLVIAGEADRPASWQYIQEAQRVYRLYDREEAAGCFLHMTGHQPTSESIRTAYAWLEEQFGLSAREWSLDV
jgi:predicted esterase